MQVWTRILLVLGLTVGALGFAANARPDWAAAVGLDWWDVVEATRIQQAERVRTAVLERSGQMVKMRMAAKRETCQRLADGELTLFEAAAWFGCFNAYSEDPFRNRTPGDSEGEKLCRDVIGWMAAQLKEGASPTCAEEECRRLEEVLAQHIGRYGTVVLPKLSD